MQDQGRDSLIEALRIAEDAIHARLRQLDAERAALKTALKDLVAIKSRARLP
jgi:hypothetical protein